MKGRKPIDAAPGFCYNTPWENGFIRSVADTMSTAYVYETHMHTCQASACGKSPGRDYIQKYIDAGYAGIMITDHFFRGNCGVDRRLPWREFVNRFCAGYEDALNEGEKRGFPVSFGWEENFDGDEYLIYGLDKAWMIAHPDMPEWTRKQQYDIVRAAGGCVVQAHPFRARSYNHTIYLAHALCDAVEIYNAGTEPKWNSLAARYAAVVGLPVTAGSDNHCADTMRPEKTAGVAFDRPLDSVRDYVAAILERRPFGLCLPGPAEEWTEDMTPDLPCRWLDEAGRDSGLDVMDMLRPKRA